MKTKRVLLLMLSLMLVVSGFLGCAADNGNGGGDVDQNGDNEVALNFPERTVEVVVPYTAGGGLDLITRAVVNGLDLDGKATTVTNMVGGSSLIATKDVSNGDQSGHRLLAHHAESLLAYYLTGIFDEPYYEDMQWVATTVFDPMAVCISGKSDWNTIEDVIADAEARPGEQTWGGAGNLSTNHINAAAVWQDAGVVANYVPYDGAADARVACMGGHLDVFIGQFSEMVSVIESGDLKCIGIFAEERSEILPDVPTFLENGFENCASSGLHRGLVAPKGTPTEVVAYLTSKVEEVCNDPDWRANVQNNMFYQPLFLSGDEITAIVNSEYDRYSQLVDFINSLE